MIISMFWSILILKSITNIQCEDYQSVFEPLTLNEWDSGFYEKPVCKNIPINMSLCSNINYKQMRLPNFFGHETMYEVEYESHAWLPLVNIKCHPDTQLFLCSLFAPICLEQQIKPCKSLCESVREGCEMSMMLHSYVWPSMFNCTQFPNDNGLCIPSTQSLKTPLITSTTLISSQSTTSRPKRRQCKGCSQDFNKNTLKKAICSSDIALKGKIQSFKSSYLQPILKTKHNNMIGSKFITVSKRNRKILSGNKILAHAGNYLKGFGEMAKDRRRLDVFIMSEKHLNLTHTKPKLKYKFNKSITHRSRQNEFCECDLIEENFRHSHVKYLILAKILQIDNSITKAKRIVNYNIRRRNTNSRDNLFYLTGIIQWNRAKKILGLNRWSNDDEFDRDVLCNDYANDYF